ncbi:hypothetical protein E4K10_18055 [Streptomyces sp. T1317-0309]|nr:hypothetical protein E4K10_18055 [Streptomyces sp. T1317-0309]
MHEVPGVAIRPTRSPYFRWLFTKTSKNQPQDGRAIAADAVAAGYNPHTPLALEAPKEQS